MGFDSKQSLADQLVAVTRCKGACSGVWYPAQLCIQVLQQLLSRDKTLLGNSIFHWSGLTACVYARGCNQLQLSNTLLFSWTFTREFMHILAAMQL